MTDNPADLESGATIAMESAAWKSPFGFYTSVVVLDSSAADLVSNGKTRLARVLVDEEGRPTRMLARAGDGILPDLLNGINRPTAFLAASVTPGKAHISQALGGEYGFATGLFDAGKNLVARALAGGSNEGANSTARATVFLASYVASGKARFSRALDGEAYTTALAGKEGAFRRMASGKERLAQGLAGEAYTTALARKEGAFSRVASGKERLAQGLAGVLLSWEDGKRCVLGLPPVLLTDEEGERVLIIGSESKTCFNSEAATTHCRREVKLGTVGARAMILASRIPVTGRLFGLATVAGRGSRRTYCSGAGIEAELSRVNANAQSLNYRVMLLEEHKLKLDQHFKRVKQLRRFAGVGAVFVSGAVYLRRKSIKEAGGDKLVEVGKDYGKKMMWEAVRYARNGAAEGLRVVIHAVTLGVYGQTEEEKRVNMQKAEDEKVLSIKKKEKAKTESEQRSQREQEWIDVNFAFFRKRRPHMSERVAWFFFQSRISIYRLATSPSIEAHLDHDYSLADRRKKAKEFLEEEERLLRQDQNAEWLKHLKKKQELREAAESQKQQKGGM